MKPTADRMSLLVFCCLIAVAFASLQAQETKLQGLITARNGAEMTVRTATGDFVVTLTDSTEVKEKEGRLGLRKKDAAVMGLIPGLKVDVHGTTAASGGLTATSVTFSASDLETAQTIQAGLQPTQNQVKAGRHSTDTSSRLKASLTHRAMPR